MVVQHVLEAYWFAKASCHEDSGRFAPLHTEV